MARGEATNTISGWTPGTVSSFTMGLPDTNSVNNPYVLDEVRLYNRALGATEVPQLPVTYSDLNGTGLSVLDDYIEGLSPLATNSIVTSGFAGSGLTSYYCGGSPTLTKTSGDGQSVAASTFAANPLVVQVKDGSGTPLVGAPITFTIPSGSDGGLALTSGGTTTTSLSLTTDSSGNATVYYESGAEALQNNTITATAVSGAGSESASFTVHCGVASGLALWLKADAGVTQSSGSVSEWDDQMGTYAMTQGTGWQQPTYVANDINGLPALRLNGSQFLYNSSNMGLNADMTIITVAMTSNPGVVEESFCAGDHNTGANRGLGYVSSLQFFEGFNDGVVGAGTPAPDTFVEEAATLDSSRANVVFYRNGSETASTTISSVQNMGSGMTVGCRSADDVCNWQGDIAEVLVYDHLLSSTEMNEVGAYLGDKYEIYNPNATWPLAYSSDVQAEIALHQWNKSQADNYVAMQSSNPSMLTDGLVVWLKADSGVTQSGGNVSAWEDQTGNDSMTQPTSGNQPTYVASDVNGEPALRFNGSQWLASSIPNVGLNADMTIIQVSSTTNPTALLEDAVWLGSGSTGQNRALGYNVGSLLFDTDYISAAGTPAPPANTFVAEVAALNSIRTGVTFYRNGTETGTGTLSGVQDLTSGITVGAVSGGAFPWQGDIAEVLIYDHQLSSGELAQVDGYLADKYGYYSPNATWPSAYSSDVQALITAYQWTKPQADAYVALQSDTSGVVTTGLMLWLKADAGVTQDGSGNVSSWADQALTNTMTQSTSADRPAYVASDINGKPALRFTGSQWLANPANLNLNADMSMIVVGSTTNPSHENSLYLGNSTYAANRGIGYYQLNQLFDANGVFAEGAAGDGSGAFDVEATTLDSTLTNVAFYRNGVETATGTLSGVQDMTPGIVVGAFSTGTFGWQGDIAEVLVYDHKLTSTELQQVSVYLANKYNLPYDGFTAPTISPAGGSYSGSQTVTISGPASPAVIKYTLDGSEPTIYSTTYTGSFSLTGSALVQATVFLNGAIASPMASEQFTFGGSNLPTVPTSLTETVVSGHEIDLAWTLSGQLNYGEINVYRSSDGGTTYQLMDSLDPTATSYADTSVQSGSSYLYYVGTLNTSGESDTSASSLTATSSGTMSISVSAPSGATSLP